MKLRLVQTKPEAGDATSLLFKPQQPISWQAGQYMEYSLPHSKADDRGQKRWFTISSAPHEGVVQITTRFIDKKSSFKASLQHLELGDEVEAEGPDGDFVLAEDDPRRPIVFIAGGIGITPFRSILADRHHRGLKLPITLLYGSRTPDIVFREELDELQKAHPELMVHYIVSPEKIDEEAVKRYVPDTHDAVIYISGPEPMVEALEALLKNLGLQEQNIRTDYFPGYEWEN